MWALGHGRVDSLRMLLKAGADLNSRNEVNAWYVSNHVCLLRRLFLTSPFESENVVSPGMGWDGIGCADHSTCFQCS